MSQNNAVTFMRDNVNGNFVVRCGVYKNGDYWYKMEDGHRYRLKQSEIATLERFNFKPRVKNG